MWWKAQKMRDHIKSPWIQNVKGGRAEHAVWRARKVGGDKSESDGSGDVKNSVGV